MYAAFINAHDHCLLKNIGKNNNNCVQENTVSVHINLENREKCDRKAIKMARRSTGIEVPSVQPADN